MAGRAGPGKREMIVSIVGHVVVIVLAWIATQFRPAPTFYETVQIQMFSPPPAQAEEVQEVAVPEEELVVEAPEPEEESPPPPEPEEVTPTPEPVTQPEPTPDPPPEDPPERTTTDDPEAETSEEGGEDLNVRLEGLRRDYPAYYGNIVSQLRLCFRAPAGRHSATVRFQVHRDGTVSEIDKVESTGNLAFDVRAIEAVERCGETGRFGPLPDEFPWDVLPIEFFFAPRGG